MRRACEQALGREWVERVLGARDWLALDDGQELELQRLYAALRVLDLEAESALGLVRLRLGELRRDMLDALAEARGTLAPTWDGCRQVPARGTE